MGGSQSDTVVVAFGAVGSSKACSERGDGRYRLGWTGQGTEREIGHWIIVLTLSPPRKLNLHYFTS